VSARFHLPEFGVGKHVPVPPAQWDNQAYPGQAVTVQLPASVPECSPWAYRGEWFLCGLAIGLIVMAWLARKQISLKTATPGRSRAEGDNLSDANSA
jgi:hypothetical protein